MLRRSSAEIVLHQHRHHVVMLPELIYYFASLAGSRRRGRHQAECVMNVKVSYVWYLIRMDREGVRLHQPQDEEKNLLLPPFTPRPYYLGYRDYIILFGIYMSFSRFQYELLVHTSNTDVYRRILECRFTHFAPYVALSLAPRPSSTWWTCSNLFGLI